jgi:hypothetical protein
MRPPLFVMSAACMFSFAEATLFLSSGGRMPVSVQHGQTKFNRILYSLGIIYSLGITYSTLITIDLDL